MREGWVTDGVGVFVSLNGGRGGEGVKLFLTRKNSKKEEEDEKEGGG